MDLSDRLVAGDWMGQPNVEYLSLTPRAAGTLCLGLIEPGIPRYSARCWVAQPIPPFGGDLEALAPAVPTDALGGPRRPS